MITDWPVTVGRELWHGTDCDSVTKICTYEFNRSYCGKNGEFTITTIQLLLLLCSYYYYYTVTITTIQLLLLLYSY